MSDAELTQYNENAPVEKVKGNAGEYDVVDFLGDAGCVLVSIPVDFFNNTVWWFAYGPADGSVKL